MSGMHQWASESDQGWETHLKGTEWDRAAWVDVEIGGLEFAVCPRCHTLVRCVTPSGDDGLLAHRNSSAHMTGAFGAF